MAFENYADAVAITAIAGQMFPVRVRRVFATGTSATNLTGLR